MNAASEQVNRELREMYAEYTDPLQIAKREVREREKKFIKSQKQRLGV